MYITLVVLILFVCLLLGLVVLAQNPKGGGISSQFGAGGAAQLMGVKRTGDLLERLTWGLAIALIVLSLGTHVIGGAGAGPVRSVNQQKALETRIPTAPAPVGPGAPGTTVPGAAAPGTAPSAAPTAPAQQPAPTPAQ
ncbi:preprotein translocase subunit SecG [Hymenobacter wooponensis]|uniref:Protein-export membrane protein SecG n=1 Tax=Hymenobacter wooponensis TaxID=1525360 RepID=A0A4Z0MHN6_9BACT|nr:preprotein translocase subunit SecG [Hymenobacter wooponensis]TGD79322.1 preprotein translocase subunit SecG [Hymenobacter wooponensis]